MPKGKYDTWILEAKKMKALSERHNRKDGIDDTLYVCYFKGGGRLVWDLGKMDKPETDTKWCPKTTAEATGHKEKLVFLLEPSEAIIDE
ncbi:hypothetical protein [Salinibacter grassmerensis]|uniref:hypothetical protein n=1 Tax=Salinibacter grassmerensis TaxID=3040353 RepID=UPI0021E6DADF|nr:hypothetical protein [Salinibacter grassmerensis]